MDQSKQSACVFFVGLLAFCCWCMGGARAAAQGGFVRRNERHFVLDGKRLYVSGFNAYWLMVCASQPSLVSKVTEALTQTSASGLTVARTWAFSDGGQKPLQYSPGRYDESMFKALDFVVSEARKHGIKLILSLVNNYKDFGGRHQYVEWAKLEGQRIKSDDDFYTNPVVKNYYKNHVKTVLTRVNTINGVAYRDDPTIFAWELINEPRCMSDLSGSTFQKWVAEMAAYLKTIDRKHLLEIGLEGFYGGSSDRKNFNPNGEVGTDFIANNQVPEIDFATIHAYSDQWLPPNADQLHHIRFLKRWISIHTADTDNVIKKPLMLNEFGLSSKDRIFSQPTKHMYYQVAYDAIYSSAESGRSYVGSLFWQLLVEGMDQLKDGYEVVFSEDPSTAALIKNQSEKLRKIFAATNTTNKD